MVSLQDYAGREQSYVKHIFLESYLEALVHKTASSYQHIVCVDGFAGPWQSANEKFEDTSFGIALNALRRARGSWKEKGRDAKMSAFLVERDAAAYEKLVKVPAVYPDISIHTYNADFLDVVPKILNDIPREAFAFFLVDPKGWRIPLRRLEALLSRPHSEVVFNFMFDFINRAVNIRDANIVAGLDELIPSGDWRAKLEAVENSGGVTPAVRKAILAGAFGQSLRRLGNYEYVAETTVLRPLKDRPLYCLFYATRHPRGMEVFRDCQVRAMKEESKTRAATKLKHTAAATGQIEIFESLHDMAPDKLETFLQNERLEAETTLIALAPKAPAFVTYETLRAQVLARHVVRVPDVNELAARLYRDKKLSFPDWQKGKRVPQVNYRSQRP
jgi:three-Cys-motif partner protein